MHVRLRHSGGLSAFGGVLLAGYASHASQAMGDAYLLPSIAAVVLGGTSILGGRGSYLGTVAGVILITLLQSILSVMQMQEFGRQVIYGVVIIVDASALRPREAVPLRRRDRAGAVGGRPDAVADHQRAGDARRPRRPARGAAVMRWTRLAGGEAAELDARLVHGGQRRARTRRNTRCRRSRRPKRRRAPLTPSSRLP